jgi:hypothetical protein
MTEFLLAVIAVLLGAIGFFVKKILDKTDKLETEFKPIPPAILEIQHKFTEAGHSLIHPLTVKPGSPLELTDYGKRLIKESGFNNVLKKCRNALVQKVRDRHPTTNYGIQEESINVIKELLNSDDETLKPLKDYAYNNGLPIDILVQPAGIVLRDEVMKELQF